MIQADRDSLLSVAAMIDEQNRNITSLYQELKGAVGRLDTAWNGKASGNAIAAFNKLSGQFCNSRSSVMTSLSGALRAFANGYSVTEETNISLQDLFQ